MDKKVRIAFTEIHVDVAHGDATRANLGLVFQDVHVDAANQMKLAGMLACSKIILSEKDGKLYIEVQEKEAN